MVVHINADELENIDLGPAMSIGLYIGMIIFYLPDIMATFA